MNTVAVGAFLLLFLTTVFTIQTVFGLKQYIS